MLRRLSWFFAVSLLLVAASAWAQMPPAADTFISTSSPHTNFGTSPSLAIQASGSTAFITFDLSALPASAQVNKATLQLFLTGFTHSGTISVYPVLGPWAELTLTHNNAPILGATPVSSDRLSRARAGTGVTSTKLLWSQEPPEATLHDTRE